MFYEERLFKRISDTKHILIDLILILSVQNPKWIRFFIEKVTILPFK